MASFGEGNRTMTSSHCHRHTWDIAEAACRACKHSYCESCLVYAGRSEEPICVPCALSIAGVRTSRQPRVGRKQRRAIEREARAAAVPAAPDAGAVREQEAQAWAMSESPRLDFGAT